MLTIIVIMKRRPPLMHYADQGDCGNYQVNKCISEKRSTSYHRPIIRTLHSHIPLAVYDYKVNGRSPVEWIMERYEVSIDKKSGIKNDHNAGAKNTETALYS